MILTREETLTRLCVIVTNVGDHLETVHDCFCGENPISRLSNVQVDERVMLWIEAAVRARMREMSE